MKKTTDGYCIHFAPSLIRKYPGILVANFAIHMAEYARETNVQKDVFEDFRQDEIDKHISIINGLGVFILNMQNQFQPFNRTVAMRWQATIRVEHKKAELLKGSSIDEISTEITQFDSLVLLAIYLKNSSTDVKKVLPHLSKGMCKIIKAI